MAKKPDPTPPTDTVAEEQDALPVITEPEPILLLAEVMQEGITLDGVLRCKGDLLRLPVTRATYLETNGRIRIIHT